MPSDLPSPERCREIAAERDREASELERQAHAKRAEAMLCRELAERQEKLGRELAGSAQARPQSAQKLPSRGTTVTRKEHGRQMGRARRRNADSPVYRWLDEHGRTVEWLAGECTRNGARTSESALKAAIRGAMGQRPYPAPKALRRAVQRVTGGVVGDDAWPLHAD